MKQSGDESRRGFLKTGSLMSLAFAVTPAALGEAFADSNSPLTQKENTMAHGSAAHAGSEQANAIRPFHVNVPEAELTELRRRIKAARWPDQETVRDTTQGVQLATMQKLANYWATTHNWRNVESRLNALPQFMTTIDGLDIHFIHVRSKNPNALPVIITHGWPGSIIGKTWGQTGRFLILCLGNAAASTYCSCECAASCGSQAFH